MHDAFDYQPYGNFGRARVHEWEFGYGSYEAEKAEGEAEYLRGVLVRNGYPNASVKWMSWGIPGFRVDLR